jgi:hypothetical protein
MNKKEPPAFKGLTIWCVPGQYCYLTVVDKEHATMTSLQPDDMRSNAAVSL